MSKFQRKGGHTVTRLTVHVVWATKYRFPILRGDIQKRCRMLLRQICEAEDVRILSGVVSRNHVHMHLEYPPKVSISGLVKRLQGRSSRRLQEEFPKLRDRYWGRHFWAIGFGAWTTGNITDEIVQEYLQHHERRADDDAEDNFILEK